MFDMFILSVSAQHRNGQTDRIFIALCRRAIKSLKLCYEIMWRYCSECLWTCISQGFWLGQL